MVIGGFEIKESDLKENIMKEELTRPVNIIELARKLNDAVEMSDKDFWDVLDSLFGLSNIEQNSILEVIWRKEKVSW